MKRLIVCIAVFYMLCTEIVFATDGIPNEQSWSIINLMLMLCTVFALLKLSRKTYNIAAIILVLCSILLFVFTQHTCYDIVFCDGWTVWFVAIYIGEVLARYLGIEKIEEQKVVRL